MAAAAGAEQEAATVQARHRLAQAKATTAALTQHLADARIRLATRQHLDRLVQQRPSDRQPDAEYPRKLLERANQLRQEVDARTCTKVVATSVVNAIDQQVLITNHLAAPATTTAPRQSDQEIADLLQRKDDLSFRLLTLRKDLRAITLERTKLRRRLHALNRENAASVAFLEKTRREPPLLSSAAAEELVAQLSPALQAYHASLNDALVVTSAKLVRLNHIFQKLVGELALPLHTYHHLLAVPLPSSSTTSATPRLDHDPPPPSARAGARALSSGEGRTPSSSSSSHATRKTRIPIIVGTKAGLQDSVEMRMLEEQPHADEGHQQRGREEGGTTITDDEDDDDDDDVKPEKEKGVEKEEEEEEAEEEEVLLTPSKLLELVLLAGRHVDEEFDRPAADDDDEEEKEEAAAANIRTTQEEEEGEGTDDDLELALEDWRDEDEDEEEVKAEMAEWERIRREQDPWLVARRRERERERERHGLAS